MHFLLIKYKNLFIERTKRISHNYNKKWPRTQDIRSYILNEQLIAERKIYKIMRAMQQPASIISEPKSGFDVDDLNDLNMLKFLKKMELNLDNYKFQTIDAPYPVSFIDNFIDKKLRKYLEK